MIQDQTVQKLMKLCEPRTFKGQEYICFEGQPGNEMYIILRGSVGVYVNSAVDTLTEVSRIMTGDFFGEMSIFDNLPRSASCIALEDTVCVAINKDRLTDFLTTCPEMAVKLLENMSGRIRRLDNELYKTEKFVRNAKVKEFEIPEGYSFSHKVEEPYHDLKYVEQLATYCPVCGKDITVNNIKKQIMSIRRIDPDGRIRYAEYDTLWNDVWYCPYCHYSNHYLSFFRMMPFKRETIKKLLKEQHVPVIENAKHLDTMFDQLFLRYIQAIHINEAVNMNDSLLIGRLWLNLYWLLTDANDEAMSKYCAEKAAPLLAKAYEDNTITDEYSKQIISLTIASLYALCGSKDEAKKFCELAVGGEDSELRGHAMRLRERI